MLCTTIPFKCHLVAWSFNEICMILDIPPIGYLYAIHDRHFYENLCKQNDCLFDCDYQVGGQILLLQPDPTKLGPLTSGPYPI